MTEQRDFNIEILNYDAYAFAIIEIYNVIASARQIMDELVSKLDKSKCYNSLGIHLSGKGCDISEVNDIRNLVSNIAQFSTVPDIIVLASNFNDMTPTLGILIKDLDKCYKGRVNIQCLPTDEEGIMMSMSKLRVLHNFYIHQVPVRNIDLNFELSAHTDLLSKCLDLYDLRKIVANDDKLTII